MPSRTTLLLAAALTLTSLGLTANQPAPSSPLPTPHLPTGLGLYIQNRAPLAAAPFQKLPIGAIVPKGYLRHQLQLMADGMFGNLEEISPFLKYEGNGWVHPDIKGGWEELPYYLKGIGDLGYVLGDEKIIARAKKWIDGILLTQEPSGWFGPKGLKTSLDGRPDLWPHMPVLNALQSWYEYTEHKGQPDARILPFMTAYFKWVATQPDDTFSLGYWPKLRWGDCLGTVHWLYNRTGDATLLPLAERMHKHSAKWEDGVINNHNVNFAQGFREPAQWGVQSKDPKHLVASEKTYDKMMADFGQFPGGGFAGDENTRPGYTDPRQGFETCGIVEYMLSFEMLAAMTGNSVWADRTEELAFNSLPASMTPDLKALHYLTAANQIQLDERNKAPGIQNRGTMFSYSPKEVYRCCQHNHGMGWPYFAEYTFLASADGGLLANLYAPCEVTAKVADGKTVTIIEETDYPFDGSIKFTVKTADGQPVKFPLHFRVPGWSKGYKFADFKGTPSDSYSFPPFNTEPQEPREPATIDRLWKSGETFIVTFPMPVTVKHWPTQKNAVSIHRGPLAFAYSPGENWEKYGGTDTFPEQNVLATKPFNFGLDLAATGERLEAVLKPGPLADQPFSLENNPLTIQVKGRQIPQWQKDSNDLLQPLQPSPAKTDAPLETLTLIPMGAARLRISSFPTVSPTEGTPWKKTPAGPRASHVHDSDTLGALFDNLLPKSSADKNIPRLTFWPHRGPPAAAGRSKPEWIDFDTDPKQDITSVSLYFFDDTPTGGHCALPQSWKLLYRDPTNPTVWNPVEATYPVTKDAFSKATFPALHATALRVEITLAPTVSAGVLEAQVNDAVPMPAPEK